MRLPFKNVTVFAGYVGNDPELRALASGDATLSLRIVSKHSYKQDNVWHTQDEWLTAVFYRALAEEVAARGIKRGSFVHVEGRRHTRSWTDGSGNKKNTQEVVVSAWHEIVVTQAEDAADNPMAAASPQKPPRPRPDREPNPARATTATGDFA
ncbi:single-stranded DNA-binding protein [Stenotrophomonas indicatrix]|uniref:single-stranded DNA-binding protein n=1 Tax=Stenotrophomonas indicatrix TaxID=2045451 RepID=UPI00300BBFFA